jgi:hypothetical protein
MLRAEKAVCAPADQRCHGFPWGVESALKSRTPSCWCLIGWVAADSGRKTPAIGATSVGRAVRERPVESGRRVARAAVEAVLGRMTTVGRGWGAGERILRGRSELEP